MSKQTCIVLLVSALAFTAAPSAAMTDPLEKLLPRVMPRLSCLAYCSQRYAACVAPASARFSACIPSLRSESDYRRCSQAYEQARRSCSRQGNPCLQRCNRGE